MKPGPRKRRRRALERLRNLQRWERAEQARTDDGSFGGYHLRMAKVAARLAREERLAVFRSRP